ncbi:MAG: hypothetical protein OXE95_00265 [Chloroflexi bacterium]|nr:hypothetical protein [Chloroflexota bacterium]MCY4245989.1 hypothetical protein [Chloroflexota bacterium]
MIQLSPRGEAVYRLLTLLVGLAALYGLGALLTASYALPGKPLAKHVDEAVIRALTNRAFDLTLLSGLVAAGLLMAGGALSPRGSRWLSRGWIGLALGSLLATPFASELSLSLSLSFGVLLVALLPKSTGPAERDIQRLWRLGLLLAALSLPLPHLLDSAPAAALRAVQLQVAFALAMLSVVYWLFGCFSRVEPGWALDSLRICSLLLLLGGGFLSAGRLGLSAAAALAAGALVLPCFVIIAAHWARAISHRDANATLSPHWLALATLLWLVNGLLGALSIQPGIQAAMRGSELMAAQDWLVGCGLLCVPLALVNQAASDLRGDNRRITGYIPFWLCGFGAALATIVQAGRGLLQHYLRLDATAELLLPLSALWMLCLLAFTAGLQIYALGYLARLPRIHVLAS